MRKIYKGKKYEAGWENGIIVGHRSMVQYIRSYFTHGFSDEPAEFRKGYEQALADIIQHAKMFNSEINAECTCGDCDVQI
jgi:hypothetical protein